MYFLGSFVLTGRRSNNSFQVDVLILTILEFIAYIPNENEVVVAKLLSIYFSTYLQILDLKRAYLSYFRHQQGPVVELYLLYVVRMGVLVILNIVDLCHYGSGLKEHITSSREREHVKIK
jgi:hypothetical protein